MAFDPVPSAAKTAIQALSSRWARIPANSRGAALVAVGAILLVGMASLVKHLGQTLPLFEIIFVRCLAGLVLMLPLFLRMGGRLVRTQRPVMHFARGTVGTLGNLCGYYAVTHMTIADAITIQFSRPLFMIIVAGLVLGEVVGMRRATVTMVGFVGIALITQPFGGGFQPAALVAAAGAFVGTLVVLTVKLLSRTEQTTTIMFYFSVWTTLLSLAPALFFWVTPTWPELALLVLTGVFGIVGQSCFTHGIATGETTFVMPFDYLRIVYSLIIGLLFFAEVPDVWSIAGIMVIVGSGFYLVRSDMKAKKN